MSKTNELIQRFLGEPVKNIMHSMYDDYVEVNVNFRAKSGIKTFIIRRQVAKCCKWCAGLAGIYDYSTAPREVYQRHDNCRCMVTFRNEMGKYTDVWSRKEYNKQREARIARTREIIEHQNWLDELNSIKRKAKAKGKHYVDTTEIRLHQKITKGRVYDAKYFKHNGEKYWVDGHNVLFNPKPGERETAQLLIDCFGGTVEMLPEVKNPGFIKTADYAFNGLKVDRKGPTGNGKRTVFNQINEIKGQANIMVLDLSRTNMTLERVEKDLHIAFEKPYYEHLDIVIITKNNRLIKVLERT